MKYKTIGHLEAEICEAVVRFEKEYMGPGAEGEMTTVVVESEVNIQDGGVIPRDKRYEENEK